MRPALLNPLFTPIASLAGIGPKQDKLFRYLLGRDETPQLVDLLLHFPGSVIDRRMRPHILAPCSLKNFSAPGCQGIGELLFTWFSTEKPAASLCTATRSAFLSMISFTML